MFVWIAVAMNKAVRSVGLCPFDKKPCKYVSACDHVLSLRLGFDVVEGDSCPRAVKSVRKK